MILHYDYLADSGDSGDSGGPGDFDELSLFWKIISM